jgi:hypothetical protein
MDIMRASAESIVVPRLRWSSWHEFVGNKLARCVEEVEWRFARNGVLEVKWEHIVACDIKALYLIFSGSFVLK